MEYRVKNYDAMAIDFKNLTACMSFKKGGELDKESWNTQYLAFSLRISPTSSPSFVAMKDVVEFLFHFINETSLFSNYIPSAFKCFIKSFFYIWIAGP